MTQEEIKYLPLIQDLLTQKDQKHKFALRQQDILTWIKPYKIPNEAVIALEEDILEFINRACHAVKLQKELDI